MKSRPALQALGRLPPGKISYDPETGVFTHTAGHRAGQCAGTVTKAGYVQLWFNGKTELAHRVAWFLVTGRWPVALIDHVNGVKSDNRFSNLREADASLNMENMRAPQCGSTSGFLGVSRARGRWQSKISVAGKTKFLGYFDEPEMAHQAYLAAKRSLHRGCTI